MISIPRAAALPVGRTTRLTTGALSTVRTQIQSIRNKLGARNIEGLLLRAAELPPVALRLAMAGTEYLQAA